MPSTLPPNYTQSAFLGKRILIYTSSLLVSKPTTFAASSASIQATVMGTYTAMNTGDYILLGWTSTEPFPAFAYPLYIPHSAPHLWDYVPNHGIFKYCYPAACPLEFDWVTGTPMYSVFSITRIKTMSDSSATTVNTECVCMKCNNPNPYAEPNRAGGKYLCYECSNRWWGGSL